MAKINYMDRENVLREFEINDEAITMGREATNKIVIADPSVSRAHAYIEKRSDGYYLVDKNSSNGTFINGKKVSQQKLNHNDKVNLGSASLVFEDEEEGATFILDRGDMPDLTRPDAAAFNPNERVTDALSAAEAPVSDDRPLPPPPPLVGSQPPAPQPPAPQPTPQRPPVPAAAPPQPPSAPPPAPPPATPAAPAVAKSNALETPVGVLCPSCRKVVEQGARFCPFCGASLGPGSSKAPPTPPKAPVPPPPAPSHAAPQPRPPIPPAPAPVAQPPRPAAAPPGYGVQPSAPPVVYPSATGPLVYAGFGVRLVAAIIDSLLLSALMIPFIIIVAVFMMRMQTSGEPSPLAMIAIFGSYFLIIVISLLYQLIFIGKKGATPGKKFMKLRVTFPDGQYPIGIGKAFLRMIGYMISGLICYIGFLMIIFDKEQHRALHDKIAGTVVIREG